MLHIKPEHKTELIAILAWYKKYDIRAYGALVKTPLNKLTCVDLCSMRTMPPEILEHLQKTCSLSDLSFFVRIEMWHEFDEAYQNSNEKERLTARLNNPRSKLTRYLLEENKNI
jgi:hypothetical protein